MSNIFTNIFNSKKITISNSGLTKEQADELYVNQTGDTINGSIIIVGSEEIQGVASFSQVPSLKSGLTNTDVTNPLHLTCKSYVDDAIDTAITNVPLNVKLLSDTYIISDQTYFYADTISGQIIRPPRVRTGGGLHTLYINWPSVINANNRDNFLLNHICTIDFNYSFTQAMAYTTDITATLVTNAPWNDKFVRTTTTNPTNATFAPSSMATNIGSPVTAINSKFTLSTAGGNVIVYTNQQTTLLYNTPVAGTLYSTPKTISTYYSGAAISGSPIKFTYVADNKIKVELWFPLINNNITVSNNIKKNGWISAYGANIKILSSPIFYDQSLGNTLLNPELNNTINSNSGCAYLSLS